MIFPGGAATERQRTSRPSAVTKWVLLLVSFSAAGCNPQDSGSEQPASVEPDSTGVISLMNHAPDESFTGGAQGPVWRLQLESRLLLPDAVGRVRGITPLSDGGIAILDRSPPFLHVINAKGEILRSWLPAGQGPGSAVMPTGIGALGDTIWVWDPGTGRASYFDHGGNLLHDRPIQAPHPVYPLRPNRWLVVPSTAFGERYSTARTITLWLVDSVGLRRETFLEYSDSVPSFILSREGQTQVGRQPFVLPAIATSHPDAVNNGVAVAFPRVSVSGSTASFRLWRLAPDGSTIFDGRVVIQARRIQERDIASAIDLLANRESRDAAVRARIRNALVVPSHLPALSSALVGPNGETWIRRYDVDPTASGSWFVVSNRGQVVGSINIPTGERLAIIAGDRLGMLGEDPNGSPTFSWWRVTR